MSILNMQNEPPRGVGIQRLVVMVPMIKHMHLLRLMVQIIFMLFGKESTQHQLPIFRFVIENIQEVRGAMLLTLQVLVLPINNIQL